MQWNADNKIFLELNSQLEHYMNLMVSFEIDDIQEGSTFIMELIKSP